MPVQRLTTSAMSSSSTSSLSRRGSPVGGQRSLFRVQLLLELGQLAVSQLGGRLRSYWRSACSISVFV